MRFVIISGRSGAGKSIALRVLEDLGYYCVDNLPLNLLDNFVQSMEQSQQNIAVSIDIRNLPKNTTDFTAQLQMLKHQQKVTTIFLDADNDVLLKRYSETRRIHPLSLGEKTCTLEQAIALEQQLLNPIKDEADVHINTTHQSLHDLSETIRLRVEGRERNKLVMVFQSFGFKYGIPTDADYVFDVRFLPNPHWDPSLRPYTGLDEPVQQFLTQQPDVLKLQQQVQSFLENWLPLLEKNNRSYLTVAIGCTGGKHRSVYLTQQMGEYFQQQGQLVQIRHTGLERITK